MSVSSTFDASSLATQQSWMLRAIELAKYAEAQGDVPVGAVLVVADECVAEAWNSCILTNDVTAHAEIVALRIAGEKLKNYRLSDVSLYVTLEPCVMCAGALLHARIGRLIYGASDAQVGAAGSAFDLLTNDRFNHQVEVTAGVLAEECSALLKTFFQQSRERQRATKQQSVSVPTLAVGEYHAWPDILRRLTQVLLDNNEMMVTAESCSGGNLSAMLTCLPNSSSWFERSYVTYSNDAKRECLGVSADLLNTFGAVSVETALAMAEGALANSHAQLSVAVTGIAGPAGASADKPLGTVCFAWVHEDGRQHTLITQFRGARNHVRQQACIVALQGCLDLLVD